MEKTFTKKIYNMIAELWKTARIKVFNQSDLFVQNSLYKCTVLDT